MPHQITHAEQNTLIPHALGRKHVRKVRHLNAHRRVRPTLRPIDHNHRGRIKVVRRLPLEPLADSLQPPDRLPDRTHRRTRVLILVEQGQPMDDILLAQRAAKHLSQTKS